MKKFMFSIILLLALTSFAFAYVRPMYQDIKLPSQVMVEKQSFGTPVAASTTRLSNAIPGPTSAGGGATYPAVSITSFTLQPDVPRNIVITPGGTTTDVESCAVLVSGTNYFGQSISETLSFAANASAATTGAKAFKSVTSVAFPADCESGQAAATWSVGVGEKIGLKRCMDFAGEWLLSEVAGVYESTRATVVASASAVESNTADFNGSMDGSAEFIGFFFQNFRCSP